MASFAKSTTNKTTNKYSQHIIQNKSEQDYAISGSTPDFDFMVIADSHGYGYNKDYYTQMFSGINWNEFLTGNWRENLMTMCNHKLNCNRICTTFTCVKITPEYFEVTWIGDSSAKIYKNNGLLWQTKDHNYDNNEDIEKLKLTDDLQITEAWDIQATSSTVMSSKKAKLFRINGEGTNMTRCLGHKEAFAQLGFETTKIYREDCSYKIVTGSDGFWQVMSDEDTPFISDKENIAEILAKKARQRWEQHWEHDDTMGTITKNITIPDHNWDDVAVTTWSN